MNTQKMPKRCHKCIRKAFYKLVDKWYCGKCFSGLVEHKIKQNLRRYSIKKDSRMLVSDAASEYILKKVVNRPVRIVKGKQKSDYIVIPWTMDDENEEFLKRLFDNKSMKTKENMKIVKLFYPVSKKDMKIYFTLKKVPYKAAKTELNMLMDKLEDKHAGTKSALLKSEERLKSIM